MDRGCDLTLALRVLAGDASPSFLLLAKEASDGGLDALLLGRLVERVLAAVAAAGVAALAVLQAGQTEGQTDKGELFHRWTNRQEGVWSYPLMSLMSSWLAAWPASLLWRMERGVLGGDVSQWTVALSS